MEKTIKDLVLDELEAMGYAEDLKLPTVPKAPTTAVEAGNMLSKALKKTANAAGKPTAGAAGGNGSGGTTTPDTPKTPQDDLATHDKRYHKHGYQGGPCSVRDKWKQKGFDVAKYDEEHSGFKAPADYDYSGEEKEPAAEGEEDSEAEESTAESQETQEHPDVEESDAGEGAPEEASAPQEGGAEKPAEGDGTASVEVGGTKITAKVGPEGAKALEELAKAAGDPEFAAKANAEVERLADELSENSVKSGELPEGPIPDDLFEQLKDTDAAKDFKEKLKEFIKVSSMAGRNLDASDWAKGSMEDRLLGEAMKELKESGEAKIAERIEEVDEEMPEPDTVEAASEVASEPDEAAGTVSGGMTSSEKQAARKELAERFGKAIEGIKRGVSDEEFSKLIAQNVHFNRVRDRWNKTKDTISPERSNLRDAVNNTFEAVEKRTTKDLIIDQIESLLESDKLKLTQKYALEKIRDVLANQYSDYHDNAVAAYEKMCEKYGLLDIIGEGGTPGEAKYDDYLEDGDENHKKGGVVASDGKFKDWKMNIDDLPDQEERNGSVTRSQEVNDKIASELEKKGYPITPGSVTETNYISTTDFTYKFPKDFKVTQSIINDLKHEIIREFPADEDKTVAVNYNERRGTLTVTVENDERGFISHKRLLQSKEFQDAIDRGDLAIAIGLDDKGKPIIGNLTDYIHVLLAGTTGSGKSARLNSIITSLLMQSPDNFRMILIDPKRVEFSKYKNDPHLLGNVVTEGHDAIKKLNYLVNEQENRYRLLEKAGVSNITEYNAKGAKGELPAGLPTHLPAIGLFIDEFGNLMGSHGKEIESLVKQLGEKSRAAGVHLVLATQRPTKVNIPTDIRANIPTTIGLNTRDWREAGYVGVYGLEELPQKGPLIIKTPDGKEIRGDGSFIKGNSIASVVSKGAEAAKTIAPEGNGDDVVVPEVKEPAAKNEREAQWLAKYEDDIKKGLPKIVKKGGRSAELLKEHIQSIGMEVEEKDLGDGTVQITAKEKVEAQAGPEGTSTGSEATSESGSGASGTGAEGSSGAAETGAGGENKPTISHQLKEWGDKNVLPRIKSSNGTLKDKNNATLEAAKKYLDSLGFATSAVSPDGRLQFRTPEEVAQAKYYALDHNGKKYFFRQFPNGDAQQALRGDFRNSSFNPKNQYADFANDPQYKEVSKEDVEQERLAFIERANAKPEIGTIKTKEDFDNLARSLEKRKSNPQSLSKGASAARGVLRALAPSYSGQGTLNIPEKYAPLIGDLISLTRYVTDAAASGVDENGETYRQALADLHAKQREVAETLSPSNEKFKALAEKVTSPENLIGIGGTTGVFRDKNDDKRLFANVNINGLNVPFYMSSGSGGKSDVEEGKFYPYFGYNNDPETGKGWLNKTSGAALALHYMSPLLREVADALTRKYVKKIDGEVLMSGYPEVNFQDPKILSQINSSLKQPPAGNNTQSDIVEANKTDLLSKIKQVSDTMRSPQSTMTESTTAETASITAPTETEAGETTDIPAPSGIAETGAGGGQTAGAGTGTENVATIKTGEGAAGTAGNAGAAQPEASGAAESQSAGGATATAETPSAEGAEATSEGSGEGAEEQAPQEELSAYEQWERSFSNDRAGQLAKIDAIEKAAKKELEAKYAQKGIPPALFARQKEWRDLVADMNDQRAEVEAQFEEKPESTEEAQTEAPEQEAPSESPADRIADGRKKGAKKRISADDARKMRQKALEAFNKALKSVGKSAYDPYAANAEATTPPAKPPKPPTTTTPPPDDGTPPPDDGTTPPEGGDGTPPGDGGNNGTPPKDGGNGNPPEDSGDKNATTEPAPAPTDKTSPQSGSGAQQIPLIPPEEYGAIDNTDAAQWKEDVDRYLAEHKDGSSLVIPSRDNKNLVFIGADAEKVAQAFGGEVVDKNGVKVFQIPNTSEAAQKLYNEVGKFALPSRGEGPGDGGGNRGGPQGPGDGGSAAVAAVGPSDKGAGESKATETKENQPQNAEETVPAQPDAVSPAEPAANEQSQEPANKENVAHSDNDDGSNSAEEEIQRVEPNIPLDVAKAIAAAAQKNTKLKNIGKEIEKAKDEFGANSPEVRNLQNKFNAAFKAFRERYLRKHPVETNGQAKEDATAPTGKEEAKVAEELTPEGASDLIGGAEEEVAGPQKGSESDVNQEESRPDNQAVSGENAEGSSAAPVAPAEAQKTEEQSKALEEAMKNDKAIQSFEKKYNDAVTNHGEDSRQAKKALRDLESAKEGFAKKFAEAQSEGNGVTQLDKPKVDLIQSTESTGQSNQPQLQGKNTNGKQESEQGTDDFSRVQAASRGLSAEERKAYRNGSKTLGEQELGVPDGGRSANRRGTLVGALRGRVQSARDGNGLDGAVEVSIQAKGSRPAEAFNIGRVDGKTFRDVFEVARNYLQNGELVDLHESYGDDVKCYLSEDGLSGFAVEPDGNLVSVFSLRPGSLKAMAPEILKAGATHLDAYNSQGNQPLAEIYKKVLGFHVASEMEYNMDYDHDDIAETHGRPNVVFMMRPKDGQKIEVKNFSKDQYDDAVSHLKSQLGGSNLTPKEGKATKTPSNPAEAKQGATTEAQAQQKTKESAQQAGGSASAFAGLSHEEKLSLLASNVEQHMKEVYGREDIKLDPKHAEGFLKAIEGKDAATLTTLLTSESAPALRAAFEDVTGLKLPNKVGETKKAIKEFCGVKKPEKKAPAKKSNKEDTSEKSSKTEKKEPQTETKEEEPATAKKEDATSAHEAEEETDTDEGEGNIEENSQEEQESERDKQKKYRPENLKTLGDYPDKDVEKFISDVEENEGFFNKGEPVSVKAGSKEEKALKEYLDAYGAEVTKQKNKDGTVSYSIKPEEDAGANVRSQMKSALAKGFPIDDIEKLAKEDDRLAKALETYRETEKAFEGDDEMLHDARTALKETYGRALADAEAKKRIAEESEKPKEKKKRGRPAKTQEQREAEKKIKQQDKENQVELPDIRKNELYTKEGERIPGPQLPESVKQKILKIEEAVRNAASKFFEGKESTVDERRKFAEAYYNVRGKSDLLQWIHEGREAAAKKAQAQQSGSAPSQANGGKKEGGAAISQSGQKYLEEKAKREKAEAEEKAQAAKARSERMAKLEKSSQKGRPEMNVQSQKFLEGLAAKVDSPAVKTLGSIKAPKTPSVEGAKSINKEFDAVNKELTDATNAYYSQEEGESEVDKIESAHSAAEIAHNQAVADIESKTNSSLARIDDDIVAARGEISDAEKELKEAEEANNSDKVADLKKKIESAEKKRDKLSEKRDAVVADRKKRIAALADKQKAETESYREQIAKAKERAPSKEARAQAEKERRERYQKAGAQMTAINKAIDALLSSDSFGSGKYEFREIKDSQGHRVGIKIIGFKDKDGRFQSLDAKTEDAMPEKETFGSSLSDEEWAEIEDMFLAAAATPTPEQKTGVADPSETVFSDAYTEDDFLRDALGE